MLICLTGTEYQKIIENAIYEIQLDNTLSIGETIKSNKINLLQEVKTTLCKNKEITTLLVDLSVVINDDDEIIQAFKTLRFYNNDCRFIIVATNRSIGDELLSELVNMGIYNIVIDEDEMLTKISYYAVKNATYKEASIYQIQEQEDSNSKRNKRFGNTRSDKLESKAKATNTKVILKPLKQKIFVSIIGSQNRIGVTRTALSLAFTLTKKGNRVAVVEYNNSSHFQSINTTYDNEIYTNEFCKFTKIYKIDLFSNVSDDLLTKIKGLNYDYIILDSGCIDNANISEHNKADVKFVVFGTQAWEQPYINKIFQLPEEITKNFRFLTMCDLNMQNDIIEELAPCKVFFPKYNPEAFSEDDELLKAMEGFLYEENENNKKGFWSLFKK